MTNIHRNSQMMRLTKTAHGRSSYGAYFRHTCHALSKLLASLLEPVREVNSGHNVRGKFHLTETIESLRLEVRQMLSLDVVSLFAHVSISKTLG